MAPINNTNKKANIPKKQTGTVPKAPLNLSYNRERNNSLNGKDLNSLFSLQQSTNDSPSSPINEQNIKPPNKTSIQTTNRTKSNAVSNRNAGSKKNTEIVAPTRRELNDFNDYLLLTTVSSDPTKQQNNHQQFGITNSQRSNSRQQQQIDPACYDLENINFQENQRFCYPVRPIPRRSSGGNKKGLNQANNLHIGEQFCNFSNNTSAAVGVVIPTTPGNYITSTHHQSGGLNEDNFNSFGPNTNNISRVTSSTIYQNILCDSSQQEQLQRQQQNQLHPQPQQSTISSTVHSINHLPIDFTTDLTWEERLNFIQYFLSVTSKLNNQKGLNRFEKMVNEVGANNKDEIIVNSTSLEDVAQSESSDRAHSVSSIHTLTEPSTPNYEELQQRLESSNRNIQNIKDQQQQLLRLQQAAKQHLSDMEEIRSQMPIRLTNGSANTNGKNDEPDYESVEQVHNDMSALVNRMKNLQTFIQNQNELSALLGEDNPELLAEQELLQQKLNDLKSHRSEMRNLVGELQNINATAERKIAQQQKEANESKNTIGSKESSTTTASSTIPNRVVPVEFQRVVPIELVGASKKTNAQLQQSTPIQNGHTDTEDENENYAMDPETAEIIKQKVADINAMKKQLQRLKDMMMTVKLIEEKTEGPSVKDIGREDNHGTATAKSTVPIALPESMKKDFTKNIQNAYESSTNTEAAEDAAMSERVRLLHEMTDDLRNQAMNLTSERDRLAALKEELKKRRDIETTGAKNSEMNEKSTSTSNLQPKQNKPKLNENCLEAEYELKKQQFRRLCEQLQSEEEEEHDEPNDETATVTGNEDIEEDENHDKVSKDQNFFPTNNWPRNTTSNSCNSSLNQEKSFTTRPNLGSTIVNTSNSKANRGKDSADSGAVDVHGNGNAASLDAGSIQSGSSRSFSMPPPMRSLSNNPAWRKNSHDHSIPHPPGCDHFSSGMNQWNQAHSLYSNTYGYGPLGGPCSGQSGNSAEYACTGPAFNNLGLGSTPNSGTASISDPVLLQQFIQTQQMLINSVCQCNQMMWHQQREINTLNNTIAMLQERLMNITPDLQTLQTNRSESVPPLVPPTNLFGITTNATMLNRAHSEQPLNASVTIPGPLYSTLQQQQQQLSSPLSPNRSCHSFNYNANSNFLQQQRRQLTQHNLSSTLSQQHHQHQASTSNFNFATEQSSAGPTSVYTNQQHQSVTRNDSCNQMSFNNGQPINFLNNNDSTNSISNDPPSTAPIFMHHHNNNFGGINSGNVQHTANINNSNSNLLHQNSMQQSQVRTSTAPTVGTLNNQVPPGTRANNYWDNFRSYSRQNLLSSNSCKSNEELSNQLQHQQQQQPQQQQGIHQSFLNQQHHQTQHQSQQLQIHNSSATYNLSPNPSLSNNQNECRPLSSININNSATSANQMTSINSNNLNPNLGNFDSKHFHTFRNEFHLNNQQCSNINSTNSQPINGNLSDNTLTTTECIPNNNSQSTLNITGVGDNMNLNRNRGGTTMQANVVHPFNNNASNANNVLQNPEIDQRVGTTGSLAHLYNVNENIFDFGSVTGGTNASETFNSNSNVNINNNGGGGGGVNLSNPTSYFGSPDFRNMNFNFGLHEPKKVPMKTACASSTKRLRYNQTANNNVNESGRNISRNNNSQNSISNQQNSDNYRYEEMGEGAVGFDETSEEIKRNLLVNALKSDKFTSKIFESLKEDVYRQAYAIIQEKKSDPQFLAQLFEEIKGASVYDPLRNMLSQSFHNYHNQQSAANQQQQEQQSQQQTQPRPHHYRSNNDTESNDGDNEMENEESIANRQSFDSTNKDTLTNLVSPNSVRLDCKLTEKINELAEALAPRNTTPNNNDANLCDQAHLKPLYFIAKDYKFPIESGNIQFSNQQQLPQQKNNTNELRNDQSSSQIRNMSAGNINEIAKKRPESHIITYTIFKIRKEIQKKKFDDATLIRIVKITTQTLEDAIKNLQQPSPVLAASLRSILYRIKVNAKDIFMQMKHFQNQEKDDFLMSYQGLLNRFVVEDCNFINLKKTFATSGREFPGIRWPHTHQQFSEMTNNNTSKANIIFNNQLSQSWTNNQNIPSKEDLLHKLNVSASPVAVNLNDLKIINNAPDTNTLNTNEDNRNQEHHMNSPRRETDSIAVVNAISVNNNNNIMNEDLAEADQICSTSPTNSQIKANLDISSKISQQVNPVDEAFSKFSNDETGDIENDDSCDGAVGYTNNENPDENDKNLKHSTVGCHNSEPNQYSNKKQEHCHSEEEYDCDDDDNVEDDQDYKTASVPIIGEQIKIQSVTPNEPSISHEMSTTLDIVGSIRAKSGRKFGKNCIAICDPVNLSSNIDNIDLYQNKIQQSGNHDNLNGKFTANSTNLTNLGSLSRTESLNGSININTTINSTSSNTIGVGISINSVGSNQLNSNNTTSACAYVYPIMSQSDSMINNNLDSGYQSVRQPDSSSSLSNSHTESAESNESSIELGVGPNSVGHASNHTTASSAKRNSVP